MPIHESSNQSIAEDGSLTRSFFIWDVYDEEQAKAMAFAKADPIYNRRLRVALVNLREVERGVWEAQFKYTKIAFDIGGSPPPDGGGQPADIVEFDTTGGIQHITTAIRQVRYGIGAPNRQNAIGVSKNNGEWTVEGVDIVIPKLMLSLTKQLSNGFVTPDYVKNLARLTGKTNSQPYGPYDAGELLFLGARGSNRNRNNWEIQFSVEASQNNNNFTVAPGITGVSKLGHEYLWVSYKSVKDQNRIVQQPEFGYISTVYESQDFFQVLGF